MSGRPNRMFVWAEGVLLGAAMSAIAFVSERILLRALKRGGVRAAARTASGHGPADDPDLGDDLERSWEVAAGGRGLTASPNEDVDQEPGRQ